MGLADLVSFSGLRCCFRYYVRAGLADFGAGWFRAWILIAGFGGWRRALWLV